MALIKHSRRTVRRPCTYCGTKDGYMAHDTSAPGLPCSTCGVSGPLVMINRDGSLHDCTATTTAASPSVTPKCGELRPPRDCDCFECRCCKPLGHAGVHETEDGDIWVNDSAPTPTPAPTPAPKSLPKPTLVGSYQPRYVENETTDVELMQRLKTAGLHVLLEGPPGTGKTALAMAAFPDAQIVVACADTEDADLEGTWTQNPDGTFSWHDGPAVIAAETGVPLIVDEVNLAPPSVLSHCLYPLMDGRGSFDVRGNPARGTITAKPGFIVIGCANPNVPGGRFSEALLSRFTLQMRFETDWNIAKSLGVDTKFVRVAKNLDVKRRNNECEWTPQIRDAIAFNAVSAIQSEEFAWRALIGSAPEEDRETVASIVSSVIGKEIQALSLGGVE